MKRVANTCLKAVLVSFRQPSGLRNLANFRLGSPNSGGGDRPTDFRRPTIPKCWGPVDGTFLLSDRLRRGL